MTSQGMFGLLGLPLILAVFIVTQALSARGRKKPTFVLPHPLNYVIMYFFLRMGC